MAITAQQVKELRELTGAGMMDCKKALTETDGDVQLAVEYLQKKGMAAAQKKAGRSATEGLIRVWTSEDGRQGALIEINCETDFVARNEQFQAFADDLANKIGGASASTADEALALEFDGRTVAELLAETVAKIGENIQLRRVERLGAPEGTVGAYLHAGDQIGTLVAVATDGDVTDERAEFARDVAMHVAAMNPGYLTGDEIPDDLAAKQAEIFTAQCIEEGKPEKIVPRIVEGKLNKWRNEGALLSQAFVKDGDVTVSEFQDRVGGVQIKGFVRVQVGEGAED